MKSRKRIYKVVFTKSPAQEFFLVRALTSHQAISFMAKDIMTSAVATQDELWSAAKANVVIHEVGLSDEASFLVGMEPKK